MGRSYTKPFSSLLFLSLTFTISIFFIHADQRSTSTSNTELIFKGCSKQLFQDPSEVYSKTLDNLFNSLTSQSINASFSSTTTSSEGGQSDIYGLYQCRGDLTTIDCYNCVNKLPSMAKKLCKKSIAARIQLNGCYMRYEVVGFKQVSNTELLYKDCGGSTQASGTEFEGKRDRGFEMVEKGVVSGGGFYTGSYESVFYVLGQCEHDLSSGDCGDCVNNAVEEVKSGCGDSVSGQIYLQKCYFIYTYNGISSPGTGQEQGKKQSTKKLVALIVGGVAALGFVIVCLLFIRSVLKKREGSKHGGHY